MTETWTTIPPTIEGYYWRKTFRTGKHAYGTWHPIRSIETEIVRLYQDRDGKWECEVLGRPSDDYNPQESYLTAMWIPIEEPM